jgi:hypothetical protein
MIAMQSRKRPAIAGLGEGSGFMQLAAAASMTCPSNSTRATSAATFGGV